VKHDVDGAAAGEAAEVDAQQAREASGRQAHGMKSVGGILLFFSIYLGIFPVDCVS
jgi:hypothetical protein